MIIVSRYALYILFLVVLFIQSGNLIYVGILRICGWELVYYKIISNDWARFLHVKYILGSLDKIESILMSK